MAKRGTPERSIEDECELIAAAEGVPSVKLEKVKRSWPDRCFFMPEGRPLIVEFKQPGESPTPQQTARIETLRELGYFVVVIDDVEEFRKLFYKLLGFGH